VHYRRSDLLYKFLVFAATAMHWFNPVVYLMAVAVNTLCETSCDTEVIRNTNEDTRQQYSVTIINMVRHRSKIKLSTAFSTNFYGGKQGMKNRISSIMDTSKKRAGAFIICSVLILTLGTGAVLAANVGGTTVERVERAEPREFVVNEPVEFIEFESGNTYVIEIPERGASIEVTYLRLIQEGAPHEPAMPLEQAMAIAVNAIYSIFDFCIDGLTARMIYIDGVDGIQRWVGNIFSPELTEHSDADELFHFVVNAATGEVLTMYMNTEDAPFRG